MRLNLFRLVTAKQWVVSKVLLMSKVKKVRILVPVSTVLPTIPGLILLGALFTNTQLIMWHIKLIV